MKNNEFFIVAKTGKVIDENDFELIGVSMSKDEAIGIVSNYSDKLLYGYNYRELEDEMRTSECPDGNRYVIIPVGITGLQNEIRSKLGKKLKL